MRRYEVLVVGGGAAGLAAAHELGRRGIAGVVLERGEVAASWAGRHEGLRLNTVRQLSALPGRPIARELGRWVRRDDFVAYLRSCAANLDVREHTTVRRIEPAGGAWLVHTDDAVLKGLIAVEGVVGVGSRHC